MMLSRKSIKQHPTVLKPEYNKKQNQIENLNKNTQIVAYVKWKPTACCAFQVEVEKLITNYTARELCLIRFVHFVWKFQLIILLIIIERN